MNIDEIVDSIAGNVGKELDHVFKQQVRTNVVLAWSEAIRQYIDKYQFVPSSLQTQINCIEMLQVDIAECCSISLGCKVSRTKEKIPTGIRTRALEAIYSFVGTINNSVSFGFIRPEQLQGLLEDRFTAKEKFYTYLNNYIYIFNSHPKNIRVRGVFNNIEEVFALNDCDNNDNDNACSQSINIPEDFGIIIKELVYKQLGSLINQAEEEEIKIDENDTNR
jgi:hypothetical protein